MISAPEKRRLEGLTIYERQLHDQGYYQIAGVDEAGRGPLAGPVVAAACSIPLGHFIEGVNDSKKVTPLKRAALFEQLTSDPKIDYGLGIVDHVMIDQINILKATHLAMQRAIDALKNKPDYILVDGKGYSFSISFLELIKGDQRSYLIAAASILAKVTRDRIMLEYHERYPQYGFDRHKGYPTQDHAKAINKKGLCPIHRKTFRVPLVKG